MAEAGSGSRFAGFFAGGVAIFCGIPLLASIGVLSVIGGLGIGSRMLIAVGGVLAAAGIWRWVTGRSACKVPETPQAGSHETSSSHKEHQ